MLRSPIVLLIFIAATALTLRTSRADIIELMDGSTQEGEVVREDKDTITLRIAMGGMKGIVVLNRRDIKSVKVTDPVINPAIAEGAALVKSAEANTDVKKAIDAWTKVGEFYDRHPGFSSEARNAYEKVLLLDPDNAAIRTRLGYVQTPDGWARKLDLQRAEDAKQAERTRAVQAKVKAAADDDFVIGLREDNALVKKIADEKAARAKADVPPPQPVMAGIQPNSTTIEQYTGLPYYPTILYGFGPGAFGGYGFGYGGGYGGYGNCGCGGYGGYGGYGYSNYSSYYGGGLSLGFRGKIGSVRVNGRFGF